MTIQKSVADRRIPKCDREIKLSRRYADLFEIEKFRSSIAAGMNTYKTLVMANKIDARIVFSRLF
ncbi:MAG: hypothetical protein QNJ54_28395 [Prochloraceae cyanobacterium]|nr:hypothetical protein [Prochloraceae cyanobacterium]